MAPSIRPISWHFAFNARLKAIPDNPSYFGVSVGGLSDNELFQMNIVS